jgi:hypothetical protein
VRGEPTDRKDSTGFSLSAIVKSRRSPGFKSMKYKSMEYKSMEYRL